MGLCRDFIASKGEKQNDIYSAHDSEQNTASDETHGVQHFEQMDILLADNSEGRAMKEKKNIRVHKL